MKPEAIHLPGLSGLRAIAAMTVVVLHFFQYLPILFNQKWPAPETDTAELSVVLFFVLSGFLITYLLLKEQIAFGRISLGKFYLRRILRIWPPYYLTILLALILYPFYKNLPGNPASFPIFIKSVFIYLLITPNLNFVLLTVLTPLMPLWSIGVEEQFYAFWPLILNIRKSTLYTIVTFIFCYFLLFLFSIAFHTSNNFFSVILGLIRITRLHLLAIGGLGAFIVLNKPGWTALIYHWASQSISILFWVTNYIINIPIHHAKQEIFALFFLVIIINVSTNSKSILKLNGGIFNYLGKISYSLYVYHLIILVIISLLVKQYNISPWLLLIVFLAMTIWASDLSFRYYERWFLNQKTRYSLIPSRA